MLIHVLGSKGWIGSSIVKYLMKLGFKVNQVHRYNIDNWLNDKSPKDLVIYAIGITGDFRTKPYKTYDSNAGLISKILENQGELIKKLLYLSSSRIYINNFSTYENDSIKCNPENPSDLYNISKLMGESIILTNKNPNYKVVRISNVVGVNQPKETFIGQLISECQKKGSAKILQSPLSEKDYISIDDLIFFIHQIAIKGKYRIYNVASGVNTTHKKVAQILNSKGFEVNFSSKSIEIFRSKPINISRLLEEYGEPKDPFRNL
tara:strand:+ start:162 stop:950 length:789 start_codon:yes stop_codon:yes gene_type:complete